MGEDGPAGWAVFGGALPCRRVGSRCLGRSEVCGEVRFPVVLVLVLVLVFGGGAGRRGVAGRRRARATETTRARGGEIQGVSPTDG